MSIRIGPVDIMDLIFGILNRLIEKELISEKDAEDIIRESLNPDMSKKEKDEFIKLLKKKDGKK